MARHLFHSRPFFPLAAVVLALLFALLTGCSSSIGDECESSSDCPSVSDVICDNTVEGGYCTVPGCEIGGCPSESVCVIFSRDARFCMDVCEGDADCREGMVCRMDNNFEGESIGYCYTARGDAPES